MEIFEHLREEWHQRGRDLLPEEGGSGTMSGALSSIGNDIRQGLSNADQWLAKVLQEHVPQILAVAERYENSPIVQALEAVVLPPEVEQQIAAIINTMAKQYPARELAPVEAVEAEQPPA